ncbi:hypothetical protein TYRP_023447 [Tyrophagus putrescentiae]|nr:hypothetical protein TYRP_023447 [Tyrophagus putrescentiae]
MQLRIFCFHFLIFYVSFGPQKVSGDCCWPVYYPDRDCGIKVPPYNNNSNKTDLIPKPPMPWPTLCYDCEPPYGLYCGVGSCNIFGCNCLACRHEKKTTAKSTN